MKTTPYPKRLLAPLAGSVCALLAFTTLTPIFNGAHSYAESPRASRVPKKAATVEQVNDAPKDHNARSPEDSLAAGLKYLFAQQHSDGGWVRVVAGGKIRVTASIPGAWKARTSRIPPISATPAPRS
jgi:hypothetical protein